MKNKKNTWLSCYIYYTDNADTLLTEKILPFVSEILEKKYATQFFFIRYFDKIGPHIRLRLNGDTTVLETIIKPKLQKTFSPIRFTQYRRELKRYGWKKGIIIAEKQFEASSRVILSYLTETENPNYDRSLGFALQLNLSCVHAFGIDKKEAIAFFDHLSRNSYSPAYEENLNKQKEILLPFLSNFWEKLNQKKKFDSDWFTRWVHEMEIIGNTLKNEYANNMLRFVDYHNTHPDNHLWAIYESYIHMNNNRLGIRNYDEPYISYLLKKALDYSQ